MNKGHLIIISGPSGVGKGTVIKRLMQRHERLRYSVSATTRQMRPGEVDGVNYYFVTKEHFEEMIANDELLEHACYVQNYYGTPEAPLDALLEQGFDVLVEVEVQGALQIQKRRPEAILIFIAPPSFAELERRLRGRGDTAEDKMRKRLQTARWECEMAAQYDYIVINDTVDAVTDEILAILTAESCRASNRMQFLKEANEYALSPDVGAAESH